MKTILLYLIALSCFAGTTTVTFPNAAIFQSPGCFTNAAGVATAYNTGCYLKFQVTGTTGITATVDTTANSASSTAQMPAIKTVAQPTTAGSADTVYTSTPLPANNTSGTSITAISGLTNGSTYTVTIFLLGPDGTQTGCYTGTVCETVIQNLVLTGSGTPAITAATLRPKRCVFFGDSLLAAYYGGSAGVTNNLVIDYTWSWAFFVAGALNCEYSVFGIGSQGYVQAGNGGYPIVGNSWNNYKSGSARTFSGIDYVFVAEGNNDHGQTAANITTAVTSIIGAMRTGFGAGARIFIVPPSNPLVDGGDSIGGSITASIQAGVTAAADSMTTFLPLPAEYQNTQFNSGTPNTWCSALDGIHYNGGTGSKLDGTCEGLVGYTVIREVQQTLDAPAGSVVPIP